MSTLQQAVAYLSANPDEAPALGDPLPPSKLGTKQHWDEVKLLAPGRPLPHLHEELISMWLTQVYEREVKMFKEIGDEGEVWFGEDSAEKMVDWIEEHVPELDAPLLDLGTGNGQLLFRLAEQGYTSLTGIDYSPASIDLAESIQATKHLSPPINFLVADVLSADPIQGVTDQRWRAILDKGTYDAICLSDEVDPKEGKRIGELYPAAMARLLPEDGYFLITSCNWTRAELEKAFITPETGLVYDSHIPRPSFSFGGSSGSSITTIAFRKASSS